MTVIVAGLLAALSFVMPVPATINSGGPTSGPVTNTINSGGPTSGPVTNTINSGGPTN